MEESEGLFDPWGGNITHELLKLKKGSTFVARILLSDTLCRDEDVTTVSCYQGSSDVSAAEARKAPKRNVQVARTDTCKRPKRLRRA